MGNQCLASNRFHSQRTRRDSQGRDYYQERKERNDSRGRQYQRRYYRRESRQPRDFSRDMRSLSRPRSRSKEERGRSGFRREDKISASREDGKREYKNCIGCKCESCVKMRKNAQEMNVNLCEGYAMNEEFLVNYTEKGKQIMILDIGAPVSLAGKDWMAQYLREHGLEIKDMKMQECNQVFRFGPSKQYTSTVMVELPMIVKTMDGKDDVLKVFAYLVEADVPFLCGKRTLENWNSKLDTKNRVLETMMDGEKKSFRMINTGSNHFGIVIENKGQKGEEILYVKGK